MNVKYLQFPLKDKKIRKPLTRDNDLEKVLHIMEGQKISHISTKCGVANATMYKWRNGQTRRPQHATMQFVLRTLGYEFRIGKIGD